MIRADALLPPADPHGESSPGRGGRCRAWNVTVECPAHAGAAGYSSSSYRVDAESDGARGSGKRILTRPRDLTFFK